MLKEIQSQVISKRINKDYIKHLEENIINVTKKEAEECIKVCVDIVMGKNNEITGDCQDNRKLIGIVMERGKFFDRFCDICSIDCTENVLQKWKQELEQESNTANTHKEFVHKLNKQLDLENNIKIINKNIYNRYNYLLPVFFPHINWIDVSSNYPVLWNTIVYSEIKPSFMKSVVCHATKHIPTMRWKNTEYINNKAKYYKKIRLWWSNRKILGHEGAERVSA